MYGVTHGPEGIRSTWKRISRSCHIYLAARESVIKQLLSGRTIEECGDQVMELYWSPAGSMERSGKFRDDPAFQHIDSSILLMTQPKWGTCLTTTSDASVNM